MEPVVTAAGMREIDRYAADIFGIPGMILMEHAGLGIAKSICRQAGPVIGKEVVVFCGKGKNGGDGFVAARHLLNRGAHITVVLVGVPAAKGDARLNLDILQNMRRRTSSARLTIVRWKSKASSAMLPQPAIIIDAIFGIGIRGAAKGIEASAIEYMNASSAFTLSADIASGLEADSGVAHGEAVEATVTATMGFRKRGLMLNDGIRYSGQIEVIDIGLPNESSPAGADVVRLIGSEDVKDWLPRRSSQVHKHSVGKVLVIAGSRGYTGAAYMTASASMRSGAGSTVLASPASAFPVLAKKLNEVITLSLPETPGGALSLEAFDGIRKYIGWADVIVAGPGLTRSPETLGLLARVIGESNLPIILDADAIALLREEPRLFRGTSGRECVLTPHMGELSRVTGIPAPEIAERRIEVAREYAKKFGVTLVLKGAPTIIASNDGDVYMNPTGNPGMATAGAGDVLAGLMGGIWAQGMQGVLAACAAVYLHGLAGDLAAKEFGERSLLAMDICDQIPRAFSVTEGGVPS